MLAFAVFMVLHLYDEYAERYFERARRREEAAELERTRRILSSGA
jgi:hypothetical protein